MNEIFPIIRLKHPWRSNHPWIFQKLVEKPTSRIKPGALVTICNCEGQRIGQGFYNGHSRIALRVLETRTDVTIDPTWFAKKIADAIALRRNVLQLDSVSTAWRAIHSEGDGLSGLVVDRYDNLLVIAFFSAGMFRYREWIFEALHTHFPGYHQHIVAEDHVQKQESFDLYPRTDVRPVTICEHGVRFRVDPLQGHKTGFFTDQRDNRQWLSQHVADKRVLDLCCNTGGFSIFSAVHGAREVVGIDIDEDVLAIAKTNARLNNVHPVFIQADIFPWLRENMEKNAALFDVVILDPAKMTRDREDVIPALKKYLDMNKLALQNVAKGGLFATFSCTGLVSQEQFLDMLRRAAMYAGRTVQVLKLASAGADHPFMAHVPESYYLKAVFCRVID